MADELSIVHQSWSDVRKLAREARNATKSLHEKLWLDHLDLHLREYVAVDRISSNTVYVVSLGRQPIVDEGVHTWIDVVEKDGQYFHPIGSGWPATPPNYIGFRYYGQLQSLHHIDSFKIEKNLATVNLLWPITDHPHYVYQLGPAMRPSSIVRTGNIFRNGRVHCAIDTLLSGAFATISDARDETKRRLETAL